MQFPVCGSNNDVVVAGSQQSWFAYPDAGVDYAVGSWVEGVLTVTAMPQPGYWFPAGVTSTWTLTDVNSPCTGREITWLEAPTVTAACGPENDLVGTLPTQDGIEYRTWSDDPHKIMGDGRYRIWVTATSTSRPISAEAVVEAGALIGYGSAGVSAWWVFVDENEPCATEVTPVAPSVTEVCGADNDVVTVPSTTGVTYTASAWVGGSLTVTATAQEGYAFPAGATTSWTFTDTDEPCLPDTGGDIAMPLTVGLGLLLLGGLVVLATRHRAGSRSRS